MYIFKNLLIGFRIYCRSLHKFVPKHEIASSIDVSVLESFLMSHKKIFVLTGAGISTESDLPDYRSEGVGLYKSPNRPVQYKDFLLKSEVRRKYWARNFIAWEKFSSSKPNVAHFTLAEWEKKGLIYYIVTQNVDKLHLKAGSEKVIELHGSSYTVTCLSCAYKFSRYLFQKQLAEVNPNFNVTFGEIRPDADVEVDQSLLEKFIVLNCEKCGGILKPDVVFFGETVPKDKVLDIYNKVEKSDAVLVLGSSLQVYSGYRFVYAAFEQNKEICIVNIGPTRGDSIASFKLSARCGDILSRVKC